MLEDEILKAVIETKTTVKEMQKRLYGQEQDKGDIPTMVGHLEKLNGIVDEHTIDIADLHNQVKKRWFIVAATAIGVGAGSAFVTKLLEMW